jgi:transcriptional regulator with XRE-family HTH domain
MIADRIKLARRKAGLSLRDLAAAMNDRVTAQAIGKYERG